MYTEISNQRTLVNTQLPQFLDSKTSWTKKCTTNFTENKIITLRDIP